MSLPTTSVQPVSPNGVFQTLSREPNDTMPGQQPTITAKHAHTMLTDNDAGLQNCSMDGSRLIKWDPGGCTHVVPDVLELSLEACCLSLSCVRFGAFQVPQQSIDVVLRPLHCTDCFHFDTSQCDTESAEGAARVRPGMIYSAAGSNELAIQ